MYRTLYTALSATLAAATLAAAPAAQAADYHYQLPDLATFPEFSSDNPGLSFRGTGFVGMLDDRWSPVQGPTWSHTFDLSPAVDGRTLMQLDLSELAGQQIVSATLSFRILHGQDAPATNSFRIAGFDGGNGRLRLAWEAPATSFGSVIGQVTNTTQAAQSTDITTLVGHAVGAGHGWLGLHLQNLGADYFYTSTHDYPGLLFPDRPEVRIDVVTAPVPEPASAALMLGGLGLAGWLQRRRARRS